MPIYKVACGEYSDYSEMWIESEKTFTVDEFIDALLAQWDDIAIRHATVCEKMKVDQLNECERIFGMRTWPYHGGVVAPRGTIEDFYKWRDAYSQPDLFDFQLEAMGCKKVKPAWSIDLNGYSFDEKEEWERIQATGPRLK